MGPIAFRPGEPVFGSRTRSNVKTTSLALSSRPWWNFTPFRRVNVQTFDWASGVHWVASMGCGRRFSSTRVRLS
jgi:hypothetical protein